MPRRTAPRRGSLAFYPRKRAKRIVPRFRSWPSSNETRPLGFYGYKAGMIHLFYTDARKRTPTSGKEVFSAATVIETPPLFVYGVRFYGDNGGRLYTITEIWAEKLPKYMERRITPPEKVDHTWPESLNGIKAVRLLISTQPWLIGLKKTPDIGEIAIGGPVERAIEYGKEVLGKEIPISSVFSAGEYIDVKAVTKGKGFQGVVKRFGVFEFGHKKEKTKRGVGSIGPWHPAKVMWTVPRPGQMGFHTRTEYNKYIFLIGNGKEQPITPKSGFKHYGIVTSDYIIVKGSIPGPSKRIIALRKAIRPPRTTLSVGGVKVGELA